MTLQQGQLQALIAEIEALLGKAAPKLPWGKPTDPSEQRRVMEQALAYLKAVQETGEQMPDLGLAAAGETIAPTAPAPAIDPTTPVTATDSQQILRTLLQEMQYLRAQMVQPLTSEVLALQQQREALKNEVRELEEARTQPVTPADANQPPPVWLDDAVSQLRASLMSELTPQLRRLQTQITDDPAFYDPAANQLIEGDDDLPRLTPSQRLEQLRQIQSQTDYMLLKLDGNLRAVFDSLEQSIQSYCDTLSQGLDAMHGLGQQGEFVFRAFINHLAEQLQEKSVSLSSQLSRRQEMTQLQGQLEAATGELDASSGEADDLLEAIADFEEVDLDDLDDLEVDADEEVTLFQLDEEFNELTLDSEDAAIAADDNWAATDDEEPTIVQTEPVDWAVVTGQADPSAAEAQPSADDTPPVAYTQEIDALYNSLFGAAGDSAGAAAAPTAAASDADVAIDEQLLNVDMPVDMLTPDADTEPTAPLTTEPPPVSNSPSLDLDFLLESDAPAVEEDQATDVAAAAADPPLTNLLGAEMASELVSPDPTDDDSLDRITSLTDLLPESERTYGARQADPFADFDESGDTFIPAPPNENLLDTDTEALGTQVELTLDNATLDQLSSDLSRLEDLPVEDTAETAPALLMDTVTASIDHSAPEEPSADVLDMVVEEVEEPDISATDGDNFTLDDIWGADTIAAEVAPASTVDSSDREETIAEETFVFDEALGAELDSFANQWTETVPAAPPVVEEEGEAMATMESVADLPVDDLDPLAERAGDFNMADSLPPAEADDWAAARFSELTLMPELDADTDSDPVDLVAPELTDGASDAGDSADGFDAPVADSTDESLSPNDLDLSFDDSPELLTEPTAAPPEDLAIDELFGDLPQSEASSSAADIAANAEALRTLAEAIAADRPSPDSQQLDMPSSSDPSETLPSAFRLMGSPAMGLRLVSDEVPSAALIASLAALPEDELTEASAIAEAASESLLSETSPTETETALLPTAFDISGSSETGYTLNLEAADSAEVIHQALLAAPDLDLAESATAASATADSEQLGRQYGRRLLPLAEMVPATRLPFSEPVDLSDLPGLDDPIEVTDESEDAAIAPDASSAEESGLILTGSVDDGFVVTLPEEVPPLVGVLDALPDGAAGSSGTAAFEAATTAAASAADASAIAAGQVPAADDFDELAQRVSPVDSMEAEALAAGTPSFANPEMEDLMAADFAQAENMSADSASIATEASAALTADELANLFPPQVDAEATTAAPEAEDEPPPGDGDAAAAARETAAERLPDSSDGEPEGAEFTADVPPAATANDDAIADDDLETAGLFDHIDLSMADIPDEQIETDTAFQDAFGDLDLDSLTPELDAAVAAESPLPPVAREGTPDQFPQPQAPEPSSEPATDSDAALFNSSGLLTTLGEAELDADWPEADGDDADAAGEAWFLGLDLGNTGLSAVLMEQHSGSVHPLCWLTPSAEPTHQAPNFRMPAVAAWSSASHAGESSAAWLGVGQSALTMAAEHSEAWLLDALRSQLRTGIPYETTDGRAAPLLQWSESQTIALPAVMSAVQALLQLISQSAAGTDLQLDAIGLETAQLDAVLTQLQGVVVGIPTNWSDTYCFNLREAVLAAGLVESPDQIFMIEEAIAAVLSGLPDPSDPPLELNRQVQALYECSWQGGTVVIGSGATCTEVGIVDIPQPLDALSREDFQLRNLPYGGDALDLDIICQLLVPPERRQPIAPGTRRQAQQDWDWQAALPDVTHAQWADLQIEALTLPQLAEPDIAVRQQLRQRLASSALGQSLLEAARHLKLILQNQSQYQLELADQSWRVLYRDLESRVLVPYIQRINQQVNALLSQTGLVSQGINQVICTGGNASFSMIAKWLRQKFPNATIIQDTYPSHRPQTCSRVAYGLVNLCRYPQVLDMPRHQYSDYFLLHEIVRIMPDAPLPFDGILHLLEEQGINTEVCRSRIAAILEGHLPPGLLPDAATAALLSRADWMTQSYRELAAASVFSQPSRNIYMVNPSQRDRLRDHLATLLRHQQQSLAEPLIAQLVAVY